MHRFLRTVGFSKYQKKHMIDVLIKDLADHSQPGQIRKLQLDNETNICEVKAEIAPDMGINIYGEMDETGDIKPEYYVPYILGQTPSSNADCTIQRHTARETYAGLLDEYKVGISLIYYLENVMEYRERKLSKSSADVEYVNLAGLSVKGKVLLPINKTAKQKELAKVAAKERNNLLEAAKNGSEEAIETLTIEDIDLYSQITRRVMKEDIYSIIDSCFMPCGIECDQYSIIGTIHELELLKNYLTNEEIYKMKLECKDMYFYVAINRQDLVGEPGIGRRFKGQIWMMGTAKFKT